MYILSSFILLFLLELECQNCGVGYFLKDNGQCDKCHGDCASCHNQNDCDSCKEGYYFNFDEKFCFNCEIGCRKCSNSDRCEECKDGYYLSSGKCYQCNWPCKTCYNSSICTSCIDNYFLSSNKCFQCNINCKTSNDNCKCDSCKEGFYLNNYQCLNCTLNCKTCQGSAKNCSSCFDGYYLNNKNICEKIIISTTENLSKNTLINTDRIINKISNDTIINNNICDVIEFFLGKCKNNFKNKEDKDIFKENILSAIKNGSLSNLISSKTQNNSYLIVDDSNEIYLISTLENQMNMVDVTSVAYYLN